MTHRPKHICGFPGDGWKLKRVERTASNHYTVELDCERGDRRLIIATGGPGPAEAWDAAMLEIETRAMDEGA